MEEVVLDLLKSRDLRLGVVESATGGLISHLLTNIPGSSDCYKGGITAYANEIKVNAVAVSTVLLERHGAVSSEVAQEMAAGGKRALGVDICLSDTGIAGPGGATPEKPVGLFYLGLAHGDLVLSRKFIFTGSRAEIKTAAAETGLAWLREYLAGLQNDRLA